MSVWAQISLYDRKPAAGVNPVVRISDRWGVPDEVIATLQAAFNRGHRTPQTIANAIVSMTETMSWNDTQRDIIAEDMEEGSTSFRYTVDLSASPWLVTIEKCDGYTIVPSGKKDANGIETFVIGGKVPAQFETIRLMEAPLVRKRRQRRAAVGPNSMLLKPSRPSERNMIVRTTN